MKRLNLSVSGRAFLKLPTIADTSVGMSNMIRSFHSALAHPLPKKVQKSLEERWIATSCLNCSTPCTIHVRVANGRTIRVVHYFVWSI
jgi:anaerobic selenocysteine-containing dehydrogenase